MLIGLLFQEPILFVVWLLAILIALTIHEFAHAWAAFAMGDPTAKNLNRLTLNPIAHIDWWGLALLVLVGFGWGKPVPINPLNFRDQKKGELLTSLAGPAANLFGIIVFGIAFKIFFPQVEPNNWLQIITLTNGNLLAIFLSFVIQINAILMIFNLIPIPPLDGSKILFAVLPSKYEHIRYTLETKGTTILILILVLDSFLNLGFFAFIFNNLTNIIYKLF